VHTPHSSSPLQVFREKWRVCRGWLQMFFSKNPMLRGGLSMGQRFVYLGACSGYMIHIFVTPVMIVVPFLGAVLGVLPFELNRHFAAAALLHTAVGFLVRVYCTRAQHVKNTWFASIAPQLFWYSYVHAMMAALFSTTGSRNIRSTIRKAPATFGRQQQQQPGTGPAPPPKAKIDISDLAETKDIYFIALSLLVSLCAVAIAVVQLVKLGPQPTLLFVMFWAMHNCAPPMLYVGYKFSRGDSGAFRLGCWLGLAASFVMALLALLMLWLLRPESDLSQLLSYCLLFFRAQVGRREGEGSPCSAGCASQRMTETGMRSGCMHSDRHHAWRCIIMIP
jgi:hypothetical protein